MPDLVLALALAQALVMGPQVLTFRSEIDGSDQVYALYVPKSYDPSRSYPLVLGLHGENSNHRLNLRRVFGQGNRPGELDFEASRYFPKLRDVDFIVACPWVRGNKGYQGIAEKRVYEVLADVKRRFRIDEDRMFLTGISMGGGGALWLGLIRPDLWAAVAAVCPLAPPGTDELAGNALNLPIQIFHGERDPLTPVKVSRDWQKRLLNLGAPAEYTEYPGVRHNAWDHAYRNGAIFDWFERHRRARHPERVRFITRWFRNGSAYWVQMDALTPGTPALIDAQFSAPNHIQVTTGNLDGFSLRLREHPQYAEKRACVVRIDGTAIQVPPAGAMSFTRTARGWKRGQYQHAPGSKQPGAEGPISAGFGAASAILFGTKETNERIARLASQLPLELNAGAADYGLLFIAAVNGRYVVVNSGLPYSTGAEEAKRPLESFGDFVLFKGSLENIVAEGSFDNQWKVPPDLAQKLRASGAVVVK